ncbi:MAG: ATP-dependent DNA helicase RecG, partial [Bacteroidota bacterium]
EADLRLRGPGMIDGTQQSGLLQMRIADLANDGRILSVARDRAKDILEADPHLEKPEYQTLKAHLNRHLKGVKGWGRIS